jgi:SEC-C motif-containing protein
MNKKKQPFSDSCPCGSNRTPDQCCRPYIDCQKNAPTAEALMRSRYTAFVLHNESYLRYSWHPDTCPQVIDLTNETRWLGLKIKGTSGGSEKDSSGEVEFIARFKINGKASRLHEISYFTRYQNRWVYVNGKII